MLSRRFLKIGGIVIASLAALLFAGFLYYLYNGNPLLERERVEQVREYIAETGNEDNIKDIDTRWLTSSGDFDVNVTFKDEPELTYVYLYHDTEGIILTAIFEGEPFGRDSERLEEGNNGSLERDGNQSR